jgi:hypothetical protein
MLLTLGACNSQLILLHDGLRHLGRRHPEVDVFRRVRETGRVTPTTLVNAGRPRTVRTVANEDAMFTAVERGPCRSSCDIAR